MISVNKFNTGLLLLCAAILPECNSVADKAIIQKPNIIVILADDFGVGDIQEFYPENKIPTPHLDKLAKEGMSFHDAHSSSAVCSPTRYGLLTGRYNWRTPLQEWVLGCYEPPLIKKERITLPEMLKENGYATACIGKWHLGWNWQGEHPSERIEERNGLKRYKWDYTKPITGGPIDHGFDYYFGTHVPNFPPFTYFENDHVVELPTSTYRYEPNPDYVVMPRSFEGLPMAPEWEFDQILPDITQRAVEYIHNQSQTTKPFFLYFSMTSPHEPVVPTKKFAGKSGIAPIADFVMETDWSVGQVLKAVEESGILGNTLIIFTADNGHSNYTGWEELISAGHLPSGPYRGHKGDIWEGGHRVPFIVKWTDKIKAASSNDQLICLTDIYSTCHELITGELSAINTGEDSFSFLDVLLKKDGITLRDNIVNHSVNGEFAYRKDGWKIVFKIPEKNLQASRGKAAEVELYNLKHDISEEHDSSHYHPDKVKFLTEELRSIVERGTSRTGEKQDNDINISFDTIQKARWAVE